MKPLALFLLFVTTISLIVRSYNEKTSVSFTVCVIKNLILYTVWMTVPLILCIGYFFAVGALKDMMDLVIFANQHYIKYEQGIKNIQELWQHTADVLWGMGPIFLLLVGASTLGFIAAVIKKSIDVSQFYLSSLLILASYGAICAQQKFYFYHWGVIVFPVVYLAACATESLSRIFQRNKTPKIFIVPLLMSFLLLSCFCIGYAYPYYLDKVQEAVKYINGSRSREEFVSTFKVEYFNYHWAVDEAIGKWIEANSTPHDLIAVRGFRPGIYAVAHRRSSTRFFWTNWLTDKRRKYRRTEWLAEDLEALKKNPPRYVVTLSGINDGPDSFSYFAGLGYKKKFKLNELTVLER
jgi:hypothetical protein